METLSWISHTLGRLRSLQVGSQDSEASAQRYRSCKASGGLEEKKLEVLDNEQEKSPIAETLEKHRCSSLCPSLSCCIG